jgi:nucleoside-diphosphate-sugar epimerase
MTTVLVAGGTGMLGSRIADYLVKETGAGSATRARRMGRRRRQEAAGGPPGHPGRHSRYRRRHVTRKSRGGHRPQVCFRLVSPSYADRP